MASTPWSPSRRKAASSVTGPTSGAGSSFQSVACSTVPCAVRTTITCASGIECVTAMESIRNGPIVTPPPIGNSLTGTSRSMPASTNLRRSIALAKGEQ